MNSQLPRIAGLFMRVSPAKSRLGAACPQRCTFDNPLRHYLGRHVSRARLAADQASTWHVNCSLMYSAITIRRRVALCSPLRSATRQNDRQASGSRRSVMRSRGTATGRRVMWRVVCVISPAHSGPCVPAPSTGAQDTGSSCRPRSRCREPSAGIPVDGSLPGSAAAACSCCPWRDHPWACRLRRCHQRQHPLEGPHLRPAPAGQQRPLVARLWPGRTDRLCQGTRAGWQLIEPQHLQVGGQLLCGRQRLRRGAGDGCRCWRGSRGRGRGLRGRWRPGWG